MHVTMKKVVIALGHLHAHAVHHYFSLAYSVFFLLWLRCVFVNFNVPYFFSLQSLVIDQTIEKVSFCTPDPSDDRVFSYICREGTTRRWMCHCFVATRDTVTITLLCLVLQFNPLDDIHVG